MADKTAIMKEAQKYLARGQVDKAIAEWEKLIKEAPDGNTYNIIGDLYLKKGDKKAAVETFHKAASFFRQEGFSLKALALYKKVLNINPTDAEALYALGELSEEKGLTTDATKYYLATADSLSKEGKKDKILDIYQRILSLSPANVPLRNKVAEIFLKEGLKSDASKEYLHIAKIYDEKGDIPKAKEYYQKVLEIQPLNKEASMGVSYLFEKSGEMENAVSCMKEAVSLFPEDVDVLFRYAELSLVAGNHENAKKCLAKISETDPKNMRARRLLGEIYINQGSREMAWKEYLPVIDEMILEENYDDSITLLQSFKDIDPTETGKRLVSLYRQLGEDNQVVAELTSLGDVLKGKGMIKEALSCYHDALELRPDDAHLREVVAEFTERPRAQAEPHAEAEPKTGKEAITVRITEGEKTSDELFIEADIFSRYGLAGEAIKILEALKLREPQNIELHRRLKSLYGEASDKESAVTECLILNELYRRQGDAENAEKALREAADIFPEDPRLAERGVGPQLEPTAYGAKGDDDFGETGAAEYAIEDYEEEIAEADFYVKQGLTMEADKILRRLHGLFPDNKEVAEKLAGIGQFTELSEAEEPAGTIELPEELAEGAGPSMEFPEELTVETAGTEEVEKKAEGPPETEGYEDFSFTDQDLMDAQEMPEPELDDDVLEIFQEFKKGLEKELGDEDSETHYNLGIAYKEMGLIDDAIKEFQTSRNDTKRFVQSSTMLGICYMEKGLYSLVIDVLSKVIREMSEKDDIYWAVKYDLAEAYEKNNNLKEALDFYTQVYGWNAKFRGVSEKVSQVRAQIAKSGEGEKPKARKDRVSYL